MPPPGSFDAPPPGKVERPPPGPVEKPPNGPVDSFRGNPCFTVFDRRGAGVEVLRRLICCARRTCSQEGPAALEAWAPEVVWARGERAVLGVLAAL